MPVPRDAPPVDAAYQLIVPALAVAPNATVPVPQRELGVVPVIVGIAFTVNVEALVPVPAGIVTLIVPVVPEPIVAVICVALLTVYDETFVPPIFTDVAPVKLVPVITTDA